MAVKTMAILGTSVRGLKALIMKMDRLTLIGTGRKNLTSFVY